MFSEPRESSLKIAKKVAMVDSKYCVRFRACYVGVGNADSRLFDSIVLRKGQVGDLVFRNCDQKCARESRCFAPTRNGQPVEL
jgi:hypothetical protein